MELLLQVGLSNALVAGGLALVAVAVSSVCRRPAVIHALWLLVLLKLVTPPLVRVPVPWPVSDDRPPATPAVRAALPEAPPAAVPLPDAAEEFPAAGDEAQDAFEPPELPVFVLPASEENASVLAELPALPLTRESDWVNALPGVWLAGTLVWFALAGWRIGRFQMLLRYARPARPALQQRTARLARQVGLTWCPRVWLVPGRVAPMLWAAGGLPRLLVPCSLLHQVNAQQQDTLLIHELAHLRRRDHWVRALEFLAMGLYWWFPVVWFARRELREAEEQCCDAWVVSLLPGAGRTYATALVETLDFLSGAQPAAPLLASGIGQVSDLKRRLTMIMRGTTPRSLGWGGSLAVLVLGTLLLPLLPTWARAEEKEEEREVVIKLAADGSTATDVQKLQAEVARLKDELAKKMAALDEAKRQAAKEKEAKPGEKKGQVIHVQIIASGDTKAEDVLKVIEKLKGALPDGGEHKVIIIGEGGKMILSGPDGAPPKPGAPKPPTPPGEGKKPSGFGPGFPPGPGGGGFGPGFPPGPGGGGFKAMDSDRIEKLEKKLEELLKELESLRKEMKGRPGGGQEKPKKPGSEESDQLEASRKQIEERLATVRHTQNQLLAEQKRAESLILDAEKKAGEASRRAENLEVHVREAEAAVKKAKAEKERLEKQLEDGSGAATTVKTSQDVYIRALEALKQLHADGLNSKKEAADVKASLEAQVAKAKKNLDDATAKMQKAQQELEQLLKQLDDVKAKMKDEYKSRTKKDKDKEQ
jgi:beta-lactamase regulating signal transducer with metallopeptidase domain